MIKTVYPVAMVNDKGLADEPKLRRAIDSKKLTGSILLERPSDCHSRKTQPVLLTRKVRMISRLTSADWLKLLKLKTYFVPRRLSDFFEGLLAFAIREADGHKGTKSKSPRFHYSDRLLGQP